MTTETMLALRTREEAEAREARDDAAAALGSATTDEQAEAAQDGLRDATERWLWAFVVLAAENRNG
jgi:hypothetical protein